MGKFPIADRKMLEVKICLKCKARNPLNAKRCRKCGYTKFRRKKVKRKEAGK